VAVVAEAVFSGAGTVFSCAGTVLSGTRTVFSTVTVRAGGADGAASSRLPPMRPRRNPTSSPKSSPTASVSKNALAGPDVLLAGPTLLLPIVLSLHSCRTRTRPTPWSPRKQVPRAHRRRPTAPTLQEGLVDRSYTRGSLPSSLLLAVGELLGGGVYPARDMMLLLGARRELLRTPLRRSSA
jgi:hypothetical protein